MTETQIPATDKAELNWDALSSDPSFGDPSSKPTEVKPAEDPVNTDVIDPPAPAEPVKVEQLPVEVKEEPVVEAPKTEDADAITVTLDDISDVPATHAQGTYKALAQALGKEIKDESIDSFKEAFISKEEAETLAVANKEKFFSDLDPEVAAALELKELGVPKELIIEPTREIDNYLALDAAELVRADKNARGWTDENIDIEIENLIESGKLSHEDYKIRMELEASKADLLQQRAGIIQKYTEQKQQASARQLETERTQTISALDKVQEFLSVKIPKDVKDAFITKYRNGAYDKELSSPESKAEYILMKELGSKITKHLQTKVAAQVKKENTDKQLNIPPVTTSGGSQVKVNNQDDNWGPLERDFA